MKNQKLELTWIGKENQPKVEPRVLIEDKSKSYGDENTENMLIHGDNLLALKAIQDKFNNKIKCIYIDPPYNTGNAFDAYDDGVEHSIWLNLMSARLKILRSLLAEDGIIAVQIDNSPNSITNESPEMGYLQLLMDEIFGRKNYITTLVWKKKGNASNTAVTIGTITESIFVYAKNKSKAGINQEKFVKEYKYKDENGKYNLSTFLKTDSGAYKRDTMKFEIIDKKTGKKYLPPFGKRWTYGKDSIEDFNNRGMLVFKDDKVYVKEYAKEENTKLYKNLLLEHGSLKSAKNELQELGFSREDFSTPKPEILIKSILEMFSNENDWILDSFLGSGTTSAVAHKMHRNWIGIELGNHCYTFCEKRLNLVIDGEQGGISKDVNWKGGGGYKFYELAPSLLVKDKFNNWIISENYNGELLAKAICKQEKFDYIEDSECYWKQGKSSENDYIFITTNYISIEYLDAIHEEMQENESLLICCKTYQEECEDRYDNITIKKIPQSILNNCEYGKDDYSLNVNEVLEIDENE